MRGVGPDPLDREVLLAFWKVHILHHASRGAVYGLWLAQELAEHGYRLNPGTLYPVLDRMERNGWLASQRTREDHPRSRRLYTVTPEGERVLSRLRALLDELHEEVCGGAARARAPRGQTGTGGVPSSRRRPARSAR